MFCKSACSVLWRISQTSKWHIRQAQVHQRPTASGPKIVFLIHLKYKSRSHYALLHSSYLATPIHKMPYKAQCSIGLMCWDQCKGRSKGHREKQHTTVFLLLCGDVTQKKNKNAFHFSWWANLKPLEIISSPSILESSEHQTNIKSHELPCVAFPLLVSLLSVRCSACCQYSSLRGPRLKLGLFSHLILNRSEGLLSRLSRAPRARRLSKTAAFRRQTKKIKHSDSWNCVSMATVDFSNWQEEDCGTRLPPALICRLSATPLNYCFILTVDHLGFRLLS